MILATLALAAAMALPPTDFKSDGCSFWFDGNYYECCEAHDLDYWLGGSYEDRVVSDAKLERCVARKSGSLNAWLMHTFVRGFGWCWVPAPFRWGYGWPYPQCGPNEP